MNTIIANTEESAEIISDNYLFSLRTAKLESFRTKAAFILVKYIQDYQEIPDEKASFKSILEDFTIHIPEPHSPPKKAIVSQTRPRVKEKHLKEPPVISNKPKLTPQPAKPKRNFIKENKTNLMGQAHKVKEEIEETAKIPIRPIRKPANNQLPPTKSRSPPRRFEDSLRVTNPNLLKLIFNQFTDLILLQWEDASELLIDELLIEEISHLNSIEEPPIPDDMFSALEDILSYEEKLSKKYLS